MGCVVMLFHHQYTLSFLMFHVSQRAKQLALLRGQDPLIHMQTFITVWHSQRERARESVCVREKDRKKEKDQHNS